MSKAHIGSALLLFFCAALCVAQSAAAFEGDYIWDKRFKASLAKASTGQANDQYAVGDMYFRGRGTTTDHTKALKWFLLAAEQGHRKAAYKAGYLYLYGEELTQVPKQALHWFQRAALADYVPAQYELGKLFLSGLAGPRDSTQALKWLGKAKAANYKLANAAFSQTVSRLVKPVEITPVASSPRLTLSALDKRRPQPSVVDEPNFKHIILRSKWGSSDGPSTFLPSSLTNCRENFAGIECVSATLNRQLASSEVSFRTRTTITDIHPDGQFRLVYADNVLSADEHENGGALAVKPDVPKPDVERTEQVMECALVAGRVISCSQGAQKHYRFFGSE